MEDEEQWGETYEDYDASYQPEEVYHDEDWNESAEDFGSQTELMSREMTSTDFVDGENERGSQTRGNQSVVNDNYQTSVSGTGFQVSQQPNTGELRPNDRNRRRPYRDQPDYNDSPGYDYPDGRADVHDYANDPYEAQSNQQHPNVAGRLYLSLIHISEPTRRS